MSQLNYVGKIELTLFFKISHKSAFRVWARTEVSYEDSARNDPFLSSFSWLLPGISSFWAVGLRVFGQRPPWFLTHGSPQQDNLLHQSQQKNLLARWVTISCNIITELASYYVSCILLVWSKFLSQSKSQREETAKEYEYQEEGIIVSHLESTYYNVLSSLLPFLQNGDFQQCEYMNHLFWNGYKSKATCKTHSEGSKTIFEVQNHY